VGYHPSGELPTKSGFGNFLRSAASRPNTEIPVSRELQEAICLTIIGHLIALRASR
jgi:hypothetical protein